MRASAILVLWTVLALNLALRIANATAEEPKRPYDPYEYPSWYAGEPIRTDRPVIAGVPTLKAEEVEWRHDYAAARQEMKRTKKPILLVFSTDNCPWCVKQEAALKENAEQINRWFLPVKVHAKPGHENELVKRWEVAAFPTLAKLPYFHERPFGVSVYCGYQDSDQLKSCLYLSPNVKAALTKLASER